MRIMKLIVAVLLALALAGSAALAELEVELGGTDTLGQPLDDFTVETIDGKGFTLSEALKDHDMVYIMLWASWCENCDEVFAPLQQAWEKYGDRVAIVALSVEEEDTDEILKKYAKQVGITFPLGRDSEGLAEYFGIYSVPYVAIVDRLGNVAFSDMGGATELGTLDRLFEVYLDADYSETVVLEAVPPAKPDVEAADEAALAAAANAEGGALAFTNPTDGYTWPMVPVEDGDRSALVSSNAGNVSTSAGVYARVEAAAGDALAFDFRTSCEGAMDLLEISVDGVALKAFGGDHDWTSWAIALPEGEHDLAFTYTEDDMISEGEDRVWLDNIRLVSGEEAEALLAALPSQPVGEAIALSLSGDGVEEVKLDDPDGVMMEYFNCDTFWTVSSGTVEARVTVTGDVDPERAFIFCDYDETILPLNTMLTEDGSGYGTTLDVSALKESEDGYIAFLLYPGLRDEDVENVRGAMVLEDGETAVNMLNEVLEAGEGMELTEELESGAEAILDEAEYAEVFGTETAGKEATDAADEADAGEEASETIVADAVDNGEVIYSVTFVDQNGDPVPGCYVNFCTDETCQPVQSDESGVASLTSAPYPYHLQVLKVPEGYSFDVSQEYTADANGENLILVVTKD